MRLDQHLAHRDFEVSLDARATQVWTDKRRAVDYQDRDGRYRVATDPAKRFGPARGFSPFAPTGSNRPGLKGEIMSDWAVEQGRDALEEGYRFLAAGLNAVLAKKCPCVAIEADPLRLDDRLDHAIEGFRRALPRLRTLYSLPASDHEICPWTLGYVNSRGLRDGAAVRDDSQNPRTDVSLVWTAQDIQGAMEFLASDSVKSRAEPWPAERWREDIKLPVEEYHRDWLDRFKRIELSATAQGESKGEGKVGTATPDSPTAEFIFASDGDGYSIAGFGESGHVKRLKGFDILARLVQTPSEPVAMIELVGAGVDGRFASDQRSRQPAMEPRDVGKLRQELKELYADRDRFQGDVDAASSVDLEITERQIEELESAITSAVGRWGKIRDLNSEADRLRPTISANLARAYAKLREAKPSMSKLAEHFEQTIGSESVAFYAYRPAAQVTWDSSPRKK